MGLGTRGAWIGVALLGAVSVALVLSGQETGHARSGIGMVHDWSHRHVVFSNPTTIEQSMRVRQDPRFWQQHFLRNVQQALPAGEPAADTLVDEQEDRSGLGYDWLGDLFRWRRRRHHRPSPPNTLKRDWATSLGPSATVGAGNFPAKFSFDISSANCGNATQPDFVVYNTSVSGSDTQASIVAYDNLYTGCLSGMVPTTYWAYNTGGAVVTSVVLSLDGSQIAFVQTANGSTIANLVLLKWKPSAVGITSTNPDSITIVTASQYPTCTAPCMVALSLAGGPNDTNSSPFYDYTNDALYVGDDNGSLHKFQPVFRTGVPAEVGTSWPVSLASGLKLSSPVLDGVSGKVFVGSGFNGTSGTQLFGVNALTGAVTGTSAQLGKGNGILAGPVVDSSTGKVLAFVGTDNGTTSCFLTPGMVSCSAIYQFPVNFTSGSGNKTVVSSGGNMGAVFTLYAGAFDNAYYTSPNGTGALYVCGNVRGFATLFRLNVTAGVPSLGGFGLQLGNNGSPNGNIPCSAISEVFNPSVNSGVNSGGPQGTDRIFLSTQGNSGSCTTGNGGCIFSATVTEWQPSTAYTVGQVIADSNERIQVVITAGTSKSGAPPAWQFQSGATTADGTVVWATKSSVGVSKLALTWTPNTFSSPGIPILDSNGNVEVNTVSGGETGTVVPTWNTNIGGTTPDFTQVWINVGPLESFNLPVLGGTGGIVVDNTVPTGTLAGGSQVYFSPLSSGFGTCGAGNGCAVQASQSKLN
jgi:hypothetical protein